MNEKYRTISHIFDKKPAKGCSFRNLRGSPGGSQVVCPQDSSNSDNILSRLAIVSSSE
jgi:hypothetical protein